MSLNLFRQTAARGVRLVRSGCGAHVTSARLANSGVSALRLTSMTSVSRRNMSWNAGGDSGDNMGEDDPMSALDDMDASTGKQSVEKSINSVTLLGRVGGKPELRGSDAHPVVVFSVATNIRYQKPTSEMSSSVTYETKTDWHNVAVFRPYLRDSVLNNVKKGNRIHLTGRILYGHVEDKMGNVRHTTTIVADDIIRFAG